MTHQHKDNLISKIIDCPDKLYDSEIAEIMHDDELRELYDTASLLKSALQPSADYDLDDEWQKLNARLNGRVQDAPITKRRSWVYAAAILAGILLCGTIALLFFRTPVVDNTTMDIAEVVTDTIKLDTNIALTEPAPSVDTIVAPKDKNQAPLMPKSAKPETCHLSEAKAEDAGERQTNTPQLSIDQALFLTDGDMITTQMLLASDFIPSGYDNPNNFTIVNYGNSGYGQATQPTWLSEFMKYATGLTVDNLSIQRGSANILYRLTYAASEESASDRKTALSIIDSLIADGICDNDPLTMVLVIGTQDNLK